MTDDKVTDDKSEDGPEGKSEDGPGGKSGGKSGGRFGRFLPVALILGALIAFFAFDLQDYLTFEALREHREELLALVEDNWLLAFFGFLLLYALAVAISIPGGSFLTLVAGFLFGTLPATACVVLGATLGAVAIFLACRSAFASFFEARAGTALRRMEEGFRRDALSYLLFLRLVPLFPFWLVNIVPALLGVSLRSYTLATFLGIIPGTFIFASLGAGLGGLLDKGEEPSITLLPAVALPLFGLAAISLLPALYHLYKQRKGKQAGDGARSDAKRDQEV
jgi:uncharacterized membrane protein YdjX (TVP38/TMEM64 family)